MLCQSRREVGSKRVAGLLEHVLCSKGGAVALPQLMAVCDWAGVRVGVCGHGLGIRGTMAKGFLFTIKDSEEAKGWGMMSSSETK